ncbi:hypothetical protein D6858_07555 [Tsuneonella suprasediminis]|uniref:Uncharacterized protein n=1 Tax=Tsuneonella suprasediminis TaxID=2306996 RepID=A0A419R1J5_9SPHN|nr:hypothetical protein D6858_07555 [Tsuneonella suprasediminis]
MLPIDLISPSIAAARPVSARIVGPHMLPDRNLPMEFTMDKSAVRHIAGMAARCRMLAGDALSGLRFEQDRLEKTSQYDAGYACLDA